MHEYKYKLCKYLYIIEKLNDIVKIRFEES